MSTEAHSSSNRRKSLFNRVHSMLNQTLPSVSSDKPKPKVKLEMSIPTGRIRDEIKNKRFSEVEKLFASRAQNYYNGGLKQEFGSDLSVIRESNESGRTLVESNGDGTMAIESHGDSSEIAATPPPRPPPPPPAPPVNFFGSHIKTFQLRKVKEVIVKPPRKVESTEVISEIPKIITKPTTEFTNLALDYLGDDDFDDDDQNQEDNDDMEFKTASSSDSISEEAGEKLPNREVALWNEFNQLQAIQQQVSALLSNFYQSHSGKTKMLAKYGRNIVYAHRCLLLDAVKQNLLEQKMSAKVSEEYEYFIKASLAVQSVGLPLKQCIKSFDSKFPNVCFVLCLVEHGFQVIDSMLLEVPGSSGSLQVNLNLLLDNLEPDFEVSLKFYTMSHLVCDQYKNNALVAMVKRLVRRGCRSESCKQLEALSSINRGFVFQSARRINQTEPLIRSNFKLFGVISLKRDFMRKYKNLSRVKLDQFDYCSQFEPRVDIDFDLKLSYPPDEKFKLGAYTVELSGDQLSLLGSKAKPLEMFEVLLPVIVSKINSQRRFVAKLNTCLTPLPELDHILLATGRLCLVFRVLQTRVTFEDESSSEDESIDAEPRFRCILLRSDSVASMAALYRQVATRVESIRHWQSFDTKNRDTTTTTGANDHRLTQLLLSHLRQQH